MFFTFLFLLKNFVILSEIFVISLGYINNVSSKSLNKIKLKVCYPVQKIVISKDYNPNIKKEGY